MSAAMSIVGCQVAQDGLPVLALPSLALLESQACSHPEGFGRVVSTARRGLAELKVGPPDLQRTWADRSSLAESSCRRSAAAPAQANRNLVALKSLPRCFVA